MKLLEVRVGRGLGWGRQNLGRGSASLVHQKLRGRSLAHKNREIKIKTKIKQKMWTPRHSNIEIPEQKKDYHTEQNKLVKLTNT